jgi:STE24 endopeptidase
VNAKVYNRTKILFSLLSFILFILYLLYTTVFSHFTVSLTSFIGGYLNNTYLVFIAFVFVWGGLFKAATLPMDFYVEFIYEKKYNLSNQTVLTWMIERLKGILVSAIIGLPLLVAFVALLGKFPQTWWVIAGTLFFSFSVLLSNLAPVLIFPIFYRFKPLENLALSEKLKSLARGEGLRIKDVFSFNLSKNTKKANAALAGLGNTRRIIISDTLLENLDDDEIIAVFAHELGHHRLHHMARQIGLGAVNIFAGFFIVSRLLQILLSFFSDKFSGATDPAAFPLIILLLSLFGVGLRPVNATISRKYEKAADRYGVKLLGTSKHLVSSLRKLAKQNMADPDPHVLVEWYAYSHPPLNKRIGLLEQNNG